MFYNVKIAFRNLRRNGLYSVINIVGLAVSLTACLLILLWVQDELSFERFYKNSSNIYAAIYHRVSDGVEDYYPMTSAPLMHAAKEEIAQVRNACAVMLNWDMGFLEYNGEKFFDDRYICADTSFFQIFENEFIEGSPEQAFSAPNAIVITKSMAEKIFGGEAALGKAIRGSNGGNDYEDYYVSGVVTDPPQNTMIRYDVVFSIERSRHKDNWQFSGFSGFLLLYPEASLDIVGEKLREIEIRNFPDIPASVLEGWYPYHLHPVIKTRLFNWDGTPGTIKSIRLFALIAVILLVIACINYVNLITARVEKRKKEMGLRKLVGARKKQLFFQLIGEAVLLFFIALLLATLLIYFLMPFFNQLTSKELIFNVFAPSTLVLYLAVFLLIIVLAGIYPALLLASFSPKDAVNPSSDRQKKRFSFRKILVVMQFSCSVILIFSTIVLNRQFHYLQTKNIGYSREQVFAVDISLNLNIKRHFDNFKYDLSQTPSIRDVSASEFSMIYGGNITGSNNLFFTGKNENQLFSLYYMGIDRDLFALLGLALAEGEGFDGTSADSSRFFLNEAAVHAYGMENPAGKTVTFWGRSGVIAGVVKDFHFQHMSQEIAPMIMMLPVPYKSPVYGNFAAYQFAYVKPVEGKIPEAIAAAKKVWEKYDADFPFNYAFLDETFQQLYQSDLQKSKIFNCFALVAIFVSCLGLFGLVTFTAETKTKEIGIRKVLGASVWNIIAALTREFLVLIGIAFVIALPTACYWMHGMLQDYAYRISLSWQLFVLAAGITLLLTLLTVSFQAIKAATANPVKAIQAN